MNDPETLVIADDTRDEASEFIFVTNENEFEIGVLLETRGSCSHDDLGTEVAAHRIN